MGPLIPLLQKRVSLRPFHTLLIKDPQMFLFFVAFIISCVGCLVDPDSVCLTNHRLLCSS